MAVKECIKCGGENKENAVTCTSCGNTLKDAKVEGIPNQLKNDIVYNRNDKSTCPYCNTSVKEGTTFCSDCGSIITKKHHPKTIMSNYSSEGNDNSIRILLYIITFFIPFVGLIIGGVYTASDDYDKNSLGKELLIFGIIMMVIGTLVLSMTL